MTYFEWRKRPPRKFRGKPQWTLDEVYISPFTARRRYDEEGVMHYDGNHGDGSGDHFSFATIFVLLRKRHPSVLQAGEYQRRCP